MSKIRLLTAAVIMAVSITLIAADKSKKPAACPATDCTDCTKLVQKVYAVADLVVPIPGTPAADEKCCDKKNCTIAQAAWSPTGPCCVSCEKTREADLMNVITATI